MELDKKLFEKLSDAAVKAQKMAYAPYSNFQVGAAILADNEKIYSGCNVENAAYPLCQCAESSAIAAMINDGGRQIQHVCIVGPAEQLTPPCGACRQKIAEFASADTAVHLLAGEEVTSTTIKALLPMTFQLKRN